MLLVFNSFSGTSWQIPDSGINNKEANMSALCSTKFLLYPGLHLCGVGFSSIKSEIFRKSCIMRREGLKSAN